MTNTNTNTTLTFQEQLQAKVNERQQLKDAAKAEAQLLLLNDDKYLESVRKTNAMKQELDTLNSKIAMLNEIEPFITPTGDKYGIRCFPVNSFGLGHSLVIGICLSSVQAFTEEKLAEYAAISGLNEILLQQVVLAFGRTAYFSKEGKLVDGVTGDYNELATLLKSVYIELGLQEFNAEDVTEALYNNHFARDFAKAQKQEIEWNKAQVLEGDHIDFVIEDK